jgi:hypothetical protein
MNPRQLAIALFVFSPPSEAKDTCDQFSYISVFATNAKKSYSYKILMG